ncbi:MAG: alpha-isopropylmalate synthase regulatory domain-containing protein [Candidatus ainarchaeum sp.]|nr:alpha-isopropylmalate synthase regulatory domain-containing protein [Candidatus ainarchaeum sp.]
MSHLSNSLNSNFINSKTNLKNSVANFIEIMDTTLRDGEQTEGVAFSKNEKLAIVKKLLLDVKVNRVEITSALVSQGEKEACKEIFDFAKEHNLTNQIEILGFVDYNKSVDWIDGCGGKVINLLCKGSEQHCTNQLKKSPIDHYSDILKTIEYAKSKNFTVNAYLEDFSNGIKSNEAYVFDLINTLKKANVKRILLADTLGIFSIADVENYVSKITKKFKSIHFDFHAHNDYGLAVANSLTALNCGCKGIHTTVNGLGERTGNCGLEIIVPVIKDFTNFKIDVDEFEISSISRLVETFSMRRISKNHPIVGQNVFTQTAGVHADGDKKGELYISKLSAKRFGRLTTYALGKLSGKSSVEMALKDFGIILTNSELKQVLEKVIEIGDKKQNLTKEDLLFIVDEVRNNGFEKEFQVLNYEIVSSSLNKPVAKILVRFNNENFSATHVGDGGYDAFINALKKTFDQKKLNFPKLLDYEVRIPIGGNTDALVETKIKWLIEDNQIETIGISTDQLEAAIKSTEKMVNVMLKLNQTK